MWRCKRRGIWLQLFPLVVRYTVVTGWRSPADMVVGLGGLTVQAHCLSGYFHYPPPHPPLQISPNRRIILWFALENGKGVGQKNYSLWDIPTCSEKSSLVLIVVLLHLVEHVSSGGSVEGCGRFLIWQGWLTLYLHDQKSCRVEEHQHQLAHQCSPNIIGTWKWVLVA